MTSNSTVTNPITAVDNIIYNITITTTINNTPLTAPP
jgi:hypothetical protein